MFTSLAYLKTLEKNNDPWAIHWLASRYYHGDGVPQDLEKALEYYHRAHDLILESKDDRFRKDIPALKYAIGICLYDSLGDKVYEQSPQASEAVKWLQDAYAMNDRESPAGIHYLASCYYHGRGVPEDIGKAREYYRQAHDLALESEDGTLKQSIPALKYAIGVCLYDELGNETSDPLRDLTESLNWIREAAAMGSHEAQHFLHELATGFTLGKILWRMLFVKSAYKYKSAFERLKINLLIHRCILAHRKDRAALFAA